MSEVIEIDLSNYKDRSGSHVPPGRYTVIVDDTEMATSKQGNRMVNVFLRIVGGDYDGQMLVDRLVLTDKSLFRVVGFLQAVNIPTPNKRLAINTRQLQRRSLLVDVDDDEPYNGRIRSVVRGYARLPKSSQVEQQREPDDVVESAAAASEQVLTGDVIAAANGNGSSEAVDLDTVDL